MKYNPDEVVSVVKNSEGELLWLEEGNSSSGLQYIVERHADDFASQRVVARNEFVGEKNMCRVKIENDEYFIP